MVLLTSLYHFCNYDCALSFISDVPVCACVMRGNYIGVVYIRCQFPGVNFHNFHWIVVEA